MDTPTTAAVPTPTTAPLPLDARTVADALRLADFARDCFGRDYPSALRAVQVAQWALESGEGVHDCGGARNYFGLKARDAPGPGGAHDRMVFAPTTEHLAGADVRTRANFRHFDTAAACFVAHARLLCYVDAYAPARAHATDPIAFAGALQGVYASDPHYSVKLVAQLRALGLVPPVAPAAGA